MESTAAGPGHMVVKGGLDPRHPLPWSEASWRRSDRRRLQRQLQSLAGLLLPLGTVEATLRPTCAA